MLQQRNQIHGTTPAIPKTLMIPKNIGKGIEDSYIAYVGMLRKEKPELSTASTELLLTIRRLDRWAVNDSMPTSTTNQT